MNNLLLVPLTEAVPEAFLRSLHECGWNVSVSADCLRARQILQKGDVQGVILEFRPDGQSPERMRVLRYVHETCPGALVVMLNPGAEAFSGAGVNLMRGLNVMADKRSEVTPPVDLYRLSPAQKRIAALVAQAYPNREIARRLKIKEQSVRNELSRIFKKMGVWNRVELALLMRTGHTDRPKEQALAADASFSGGWPTEIQPPADDPPAARHLIA